MKRLEFKIRESFTNDLHNEWSHLSKLNNLSLFQTLKWQSLWCEIIQSQLKESTLFIISIYYNQKIIGILPFEKKRKFKLKILNLTGYPFADYCDCLLDLDFLKSKNNIKIEIQKLILNLKDVDLLIFDKINRESHFYFLFDNYKFNRKDYSSYHILRNNNQDDLIPKKFNSDTNRQIKRLNLLGKLSFKIATDIWEKEKIFDFFYKHKQNQLIESKSWNYLNNKTYKTFLQKLFISNDSHLSYLILDDKIISAHLGFIIEKKLFYLFPCYDQEYSKYSPGNILLIKLIEIFFKNDGQVFDFTIGNEDYKLRLSNTINEILYKNISLTISGKIFNVFYKILNKLRTIKLLKLIYQKIKYS